MVGFERKTKMSCQNISKEHDQALDEIKVR